MSRNILQTHKPFKESFQNDSTCGKLILTSCKGQNLAFLLKNNRLLEIHPLNNSSKVGAIYIGKVKNIVKNLDACFIEIADGELCFLSFDEAKHPFMLNRTYDGRILQGDEILVQIQRDSQKTKQAAVTCKISLKSEYFIFAVGNTKAGISTKLPKDLKVKISNNLQKQALIDEKGFLTQKPEFPDYGCVVRTQAAELFKQDVKIFEDTFKQQLENFEQIFEIAKHRTCFSCIQASKNPYEDILSNFRKEDYDEVLTDLVVAYTSLQGHVDNLRLYDDGTISLDKLYALDNKMQEALSKTIWLKSGAYLVIEQTECLTTIDVNSGKMIKGKHAKEAIWRINEEAAKEAALQIRLRNLSGIIIIDFINMNDKEAEDRLIASMKTLTFSDNVPVNVIDFTPLGLMELTRKKVKASLKEQLNFLI